MSTISAGLVQVENLTVTSTNASGIIATTANVSNMTATNMTVSNQLNIANNFEIIGTLKNKYSGKSYDIDVVANGFFTEIDSRCKISFDYGTISNPRVYFELYDNNLPDSSNTLLVAELFNQSFDPYTNTLTTVESSKFVYLPLTFVTAVGYDWSVGMIGKIELVFSEDFNSVTSGVMYMGTGDGNILAAYAAFIGNFVLGTGSVIETPIFKHLDVIRVGEGVTSVEDLPATPPSKSSDYDLSGNLIYKPVPNVSTYPVNSTYTEDNYSVLNYGNLVRSWGMDSIELWHYSLVNEITTVADAKKLKYFLDAYNIEVTGILADSNFSVRDKNYDGSATIKSVGNQYPWDRQSNIEIMIPFLPIWKALGAKYVRVNISTDIPFIVPSDGDFSKNSTDAAFVASRTKYINSVIVGLTELRPYLQEYGMKLLYEPHVTSWSYSGQVLKEIFEGLPDKTDIGVCYDMHNSQSQGSPQNTDPLVEIFTIMPYIAVLNLKSVGVYKGSATNDPSGNLVGAFLYEDDSGNISNSTANGGLKIPRGTDGPISLRYEFPGIYYEWRTRNSLTFEKFPVATLEPEFEYEATGTNTLNKVKQNYLDSAAYHRRAIRQSYELPIPTLEKVVINNEFEYGSGVSTIDASGNFYMGRYLTVGIDVFDPSGIYVKTIATEFDGSILNMHFGSNGVLYLTTVTPEPSGTFYGYNVSGSGSIVFQSSAPLPSYGQPVFPSAVAVDSSNNVYVGWIQFYVDEVGLIQSTSYVASYTSSGVYKNNIQYNTENNTNLSGIALPIIFQIYDNTLYIPTSTRNPFYYLGIPFAQDINSISSFPLSQFKNGSGVLLDDSHDLNVSPILTIMNIRLGYGAVSDVFFKEDGTMLVNSLDYSVGLIDGYQQSAYPVHVYNQFNGKRLYSFHLEINEGEIDGGAYYLNNVNGKILANSGDANKIHIYTF